MLAYANYAAKAVLAFAIPGAALAADLAGQWLDITADNTIVANEWHLFILALVTGVGVFIKANGENPADA